jgi:hypothetical protein
MDDVAAMGDEGAAAAYVYGNIKVLNHQKALEYDLCLMFHVENRSLFKIPNTCLRFYATCGEKGKVFFPT